MRVATHRRAAVQRMLGHAGASSGSTMRPGQVADRRRPRPMLSAIRRSRESTSISQAPDESCRPSSFPARRSPRMCCGLTGSHVRASSVVSSFLPLHFQYRNYRGTLMRDSHARVSAGDSTGPLAEPTKQKTPQSLGLKGFFVAAPLGLEPQRERRGSVSSPRWIYCLRQVPQPVELKE